MIDNALPRAVEQMPARVAKRGEPRDWGLARLTILAPGLGIGTGCGAVLFRDLIGLLHNLFFYGLAVVHYDANVFTAPSLPRAGDVLGVITKEHVADSVADALTIYPRASDHRRGRKRQRG